MSLEAEYRAAREKAALIDLSERGKIEVTGADRVSFLHNILTNDIKTLKTGAFCPAALLSAAGKVLALMNVWKFEDKIVLDTDPGFEEKLLGLLDKFLITEDAALRKATSEYAHFLIKGPKVSEILLSFPHAVRRESTSWGFPAKASGNDIALLVKTLAGKALYKSLIEAGAVPIGPETAEILRIEEGILRYGVDVTEEVSLPETGLDETYASETKGCYPGQEVVARTKTYKGLQRKMTGFVIPRLSAPVILSAAKNLRALRVYSGEKEIGWITSACISPVLGGIALGYAGKGFFFDGGKEPIQVEIKTESGNIQAVITALPFKP